MSTNESSTHYQPDVIQERKADKLRNAPIKALNADLVFTCHNVYLYTNIGLSKTW